MKQMWRTEFLVDVINSRQYKAVAELGVEGGGTSLYVMERCELDVYVMVEMMVKQRLYETIRDSDRIDPSFQGGFTKRPLILMRMDTVRAAEYIADRCLDLVFIDAAHGYKWVMQDIKNWCPKVRTGGMLCGHDYFPDSPNVSQAVKESFHDFNLIVEEPTSPNGGNHIWFVDINESNRVGN